MRKILAIGATLLFMGVGCLASQPPTKQSAVQPTQETAEVMEEKENVVQIDDLSFTLPADWKLLSVEGSTAFIQVPDPSYQVSVPLTIKKIAADSSRANEAFKDDFFLEETESGAKIYEEFCAPALKCSYIDYKQNLYLVVFESLQSDELAPENLDGVWSPSTQVATDDLWNVIISVR